MAWTVAVFSKESALAAPGIFLALATMPRRGASWRRLSAVVGTGASVIALSAMVRLAVFGEIIASTGEEHRLVMSSGKLIGALERQMLRTFFPAMASGDELTLVGSIAVGVLLLAVVLLCARQIGVRSPPRAPFAQLLGVFLAYLGSLVPAIGSKVHIDSGEGERFVYLATALAMLGVATALATVRSRRLGVTIGFLWILVYALLAQRAAARWTIAGTYAERIVDAIVEQSRGSRPLILALPDSVEGAMLFRNGLAEAVAWRRQDVEVTVLATFTADRNGGGARAAQSASRPNAWEIELSGRPPYRHLRAPALVHGAPARDPVRIETADLSSFTDLFAFHGGELLRLGPGDG